GFTIVEKYADTPDLQALALKTVEEATLRRWRYMNSIYWYALQGKEDDTPTPVDKCIDSSGRIVSPGFVNLHVHSQLNIGDYLLTDVTKKDYLAANWFVFGAPLKEKVETPPPPAVAMGRKYALYSALRNGATTVLD